MKRSMLTLILIVIIAAAAILLTPVALAGAVTVPVAQITFSENTISGSVDLGGSCYNSTMTVQCNSTSTITVYQYYFLERLGGLVRSTDTNINSTAGSTNVTISLWLTTPSQLVRLGNMTFTGGVGNRTHTVYLSADQGVRASGTYKLTVTVDASVLLQGSTKPSTSAAGFGIRKRALSIGLGRPSMFISGSAHLIHGIFLERKATGSRCAEGPCVSGYSSRRHGCCRRYSNVGQGSRFLDWTSNKRH